MQSPSHPFSINGHAFESLPRAKGVTAFMDYDHLFVIRCVHCNRTYDRNYQDVTLLPKCSNQRAIPRHTSSEGWAALFHEWHYCDLSPYPRCGRCQLSYFLFSQTQTCCPMGPPA